MRHDQLKYLAKLALLVLMGVFGSFLISEAGLRLMNISYPVFHGFDPVRGRVLEPGMEGWFRYEGNAYVKINSAGFRDVEHSLQKPKGTYRILLLGDSYTEARQVSLENTFGRKVEEQLQSCERLLPHKVEVINFGVPGYGNAEELITLRSRGWSYDPDLVLTMFFSGNDLIDNFPRAELREHEYIPRPYFHLDQGELKLVYNFQEWSPPLLKYRLLLWGVHNFRTLELINQANRVYAARQMGSDQGNASNQAGLADFVYAPPQTPIHHEAWDITEGILKLMHKEVLEHGAKFFLVTTTSPDQLDQEQKVILRQRLNAKKLDYPEQRLRALGETEGFPVLNLLYDFQQYAEQHHAYLHGFPNTKLGAGHWNEQGHELAAQLIAKRICQDPSIL
ncbi:MAG TPA: SGNH/GDSL hydrolase family protein [Nitrospirales bacterium]|nr:lipolytic protein G-D-S-L family [Nitrospiraceae bacterium]HNP29151.1 SGNH/GDSL hydrolase family protein [Nitrospirales bacterium]